MNVFSQYIVNCEVCGEITLPYYYRYPDKPTVCPNDPSHSVEILKSLEYKNFVKDPEKGDVFFKQFLRQHKNMNGESDFGPIIIKPPQGKILEVTQVDVIWHEKLKLNSNIVWEVRMDNPYYDPNASEWYKNSPTVSLSQFFYRDFAELWGGAYHRPMSDGPTREMQHIFTNRNDRENRKPFQLPSSLGMEIYAYSTLDSKRSEPITHNLEGIGLVYKPYNELAITDGKYDISKAASYPDNFSVECSCDDCYSLNIIGALFDENI